eukprot:11765622-Karenia_brevis.AAC.1
MAKGKQVKTLTSTGIPVGSPKAKARGKKVFEQLKLLLMQMKMKAHLFQIQLLKKEGDESKLYAEQEGRG